MHRIRITLLAALVIGGCLGDFSTEPDLELGDAELTVAFVGNSLTFVNDVPGLVQAMADAGERSMAHVVIAAPNFSLEDHWFAGTPDHIRSLEADVVVMQQGPSSLPENQAHLRYWAGQMTTVIREAGGEPALFMVWPSAQREWAFAAIWNAYRTAADSVGGLFIPAGQTWVEAWKLDSALELYGADNFHQSYLGALAAAQTIYAVLFDVPAASVPALDDGVDAETLATLRAALETSLARADSAGS